LSLPVRLKGEIRGRLPFRFIGRKNCRGREIKAVEEIANIHCGSKPLTYLRLGVLRLGQL